MSRYVEDIYIEGFRGVRKLEKPIELKSFNVVVGRNNTGKTALLEALYIFPQPWSNFTDPLTGLSRLNLVSRLHGGRRSLVYGYSGAARLEYRVKGKTVKITLHEGEVRETFLEGKPVTPDLYTEFLAKTFEVKAEHTSRLTVFTPNDTEFMERLRSKILSDEVWGYITKHGIHVDVIEKLVNPVVYDTFTEMLIEKNQLKLRKEVRKGIGPLYIHVADLGDGIERTCLVASALSYTNPKLVLWDDIEVAAHPGLIEGLVRWLSSKKWQVVLATHSLDVLYAITLVNPPDAQVILLRKTGDDLVKTKNLDLEELDEILSRNVDPRKIIDVLEL